MCPLFLGGRIIKQMAAPVPLTTIIKSALLPAIFMMTFPPAKQFITSWECGTSSKLSGWFNIIRFCFWLTYSNSIKCFCIIKIYTESQEVYAHFDLMYLIEYNVYSSTLKLRSTSAETHQ